MKIGNITRNNSLVGIVVVGFVGVLGGCLGHEEELQRASEEAFGAEEVLDGGPAGEMLVNGDLDMNDLLPHVVMVNVLDLNSVCSGTLVSKRRVLTAAHCVCRTNKTEIKDKPYARNASDCVTRAAVAFAKYGGDNKKDVESREGTVVVNSKYHSYLNKDYAGNYKVLESRADIAMIKLDTDAPSWVQPARAAKYAPEIGAKVVIAGYGLSYCGLQEEFMSTYGDRRYGGNEISNYADKDLACVTKHDIEVEQGLVWKGDSGGALLDAEDWKLLLGVTSTGTCSGSSASKAEGFSCFTRTADFYDWITDECAPESCTKSCVPDCSGKACGDDGCGGSCGGCDIVPADYCVDGASVRLYSGAGECNAGSCEFPHTDIVCKNGCLNGECAQCQPDCSGKECGDDGCGGTCGSCDTAPAATCVDADTLREYSGPGTCAAGFCEFPSNEKDCPDGCAEGACLADPCDGAALLVTPKLGWSLFGLTGPEGNRPNTRFPWDKTERLCGEAVYFNTLEDSPDCGLDACYGVECPEWPACSAASAWVREPVTFTVETDGSVPLTCWKVVEYSDTDSARPNICCTAAISGTYPANNPCHQAEGTTKEEWHP